MWACCYPNHEYSPFIIYAVWLMVNKIAEICIAILDDRLFFYVFTVTLMKWSQIFLRYLEKNREFPGIFLADFPVIFVSRPDIHPTYMWFPPLWMGVSQLRSDTEIAPKSPFVSVNRNPIRWFSYRRKNYPVQCVHSLRRPATAKVIMASPAATSVRNVADQPFALILCILRHV